MARDSNAKKGIYVNADIEFEALESLGPKVRRVITFAPIQISAFAIYTQFLTACEQGTFPKGCSAKDPEVDQWMATRILAGCYWDLKKDRDDWIAERGIVPLVSRKNHARTNDVRKVIQYR